MKYILVTLFVAAFLAVVYFVAEWLDKHFWSEDGEL